MESYSSDEIEGFLKMFTPLELCIVRILYDANTCMHVKGMLDVCVKEIYDSVIKLNRILKDKGQIGQSDFQKARDKLQYHYNAVEFTPSKLEDFTNSFFEDYKKMMKARGAEETKTYDLENLNNEKAQMPNHIFNEIIRRNLSESRIAKMPSFDNVERVLQRLEKEVVLERKLDGKTNTVYALNPSFYALLKKVWLIIITVLTPFYCSF